MPKKVTISLSNIVKQIDKATQELSTTKTKAITSAEKQSLALKIKNLKKIKGSVKEICPKGKNGLNITAIVS